MTPPSSPGRRSTWTAVGSVASSAVASATLRGYARNGQSAPPFLQFQFWGRMAQLPNVIYLASIWVIPIVIAITIMLEELLAAGHSGAEYDAWLMRIGEGDQFGSGSVGVNPNSKIPALMDYSEQSLRRVFESGAILLYLADKFGTFLPKDRGKQSFPQSTFSAACAAPVARSSPATLARSRDAIDCTKTPPSMHLRQPITEPMFP
jgi:hypothetical protein